MDKNKLGLFGLWLNIGGALMSAVSIKEYQGAYTKSLVSGIQYHYALISSIGVKIGLFLIILGFVFQIYEKRMKEGEKELLSTTIISFSFVTFIIYLVVNVIAVFLFY